MADNKQKPEDNLIDLASERQRMHQRAQSSKGKEHKKAQQGTKGSKKPKSGASRSRNGGLRSPQIHWYHYVQLLLFLLVFAYFMQRCKGG